MPEVVEVCMTSIFLNHILKNKHLTKLQILEDSRYFKKPIKNIDVLNKLTNPLIKSVNSKGKFMWLTLISKNQEFYILNTYGLSGGWSILKRKNTGIVLHIKEDIIDDEKLRNVEHKMHHQVYFYDQLHYGTLSIETSYEALKKKLNKLGPDLLKEDYTFDEFKQRCKTLCDKSSKKNKKIVEVLMDQTASGGIGSGIGNYLVAEILYNSKISPFKILCEIYNDNTLLNKLYNSIRYVIKLSFMTADNGYLEYVDEYIQRYIKKIRNHIYNNPTSNHKYNFLKDVIIPKKSKFIFNVYMQDMDPSGNIVSKDIIVNAGKKTKRTTYWVKKIQK